MTADDTAIPLEATIVSAQLEQPGMPASGSLFGAPLPARPCSPEIAAFFGWPPAQTGLGDEVEDAGAGINAEVLARYPGIAGTHEETLILAQRSLTRALGVVLGAYSYADRVDWAAIEREAGDEVRDIAIAIRGIGAALVRERTEFTLAARVRRIEGCIRGGWMTKRQIDYLARGVVPDTAIEGLYRLAADRLAIWESGPWANACRELLEAADEIMARRRRYGRG